MSFSLDELSVDNIGLWPIALRCGLMAAAFFLLLGIGLWFDAKEQSKKLTEARSEEVTLRAQFERKQKGVENIETYKDQVKKLERMFEKLIYQLPQSTEIPGLLEDISQRGVETGLAFRLFQPGVESQK